MKLAQLHEARYFNQRKMWVSELEHRAEAEREAGGSVEINYALPYIAVTLSDGTEYFYQGEEAEQALEEVPEEVSPEDYFLGIDW